MFRRLCCLAASLVVAVAAQAGAAPQILGLVATNEPVPMQCGDGQCTALLSAFCLQEKRLPPDYGTAYMPAEAGSVTLVVRASDGGTHRLDAASLLEFRSHYGYTAMKARLPLSTLAGINVVSVALEVLPLASMLPRPTTGDPDPLTETEIALATGPLRLAAESVLDGGSEGARAARAMAALINALPRTGDVPPAGREALWSRVAGTMAPPSARRAFESCGRTVDQSVGYPLRECLEERHESLQRENTRAYWDSLGGS